MKKIEFTKMVASGNDFVIVEKSFQLPASSFQVLAKKICDRRFGIGADGLLLLEESKIADIKMRIFNADGSEAQMCGNGASCVGLYLRNQKPETRNQIKIETKAGIIEAQVRADKVKIRLTESKDYWPGIPIKIDGRELRINSINTGLPHAVIFVEGIDTIEVSNIGRQIRYYEYFAPQGANVDFVEPVNNNTIRVRTYERGVEDETLACGTGAAAAAIVFSLQLPRAEVHPAILENNRVDNKGKGGVNKHTINVLTQGGGTLKVYFTKDNAKINDVWLEGKTRMVFKGVYQKGV